MRRRGPGLIGVAARTAVIAGTAGAVQHRQQEKYAAQACQQAAAAAPPPAATDPTAEKIEQLAALHASGALTDEEFAAAKAKALGI